MIKIAVNVILACLVAGFITGLCVSADVSLDEQGHLSGGIGHTIMFIIVLLYVVFLLGQRLVTIVCDVLREQDRAFD